ncbi:MAG: acetate kinase [Celeribacter sp.]|jgi:acetate kinase
MTSAFLTLNAGSSSLKFAVFDRNASSTTAEITGKFTGIGHAPVFSAQDKTGVPFDKAGLETIDPASDHEALISKLFEWLEQHLGQWSLEAVGHRVVHGGRSFTAPTLLNERVMQELETLVPLAPLHQPHNLAAIRAVTKWQPNLPQIACFDTSFHRSQPKLAQLFAIPRALTDEGVIRYGFHGLSYDYIARVLPHHLGEQAQGRVIVAHLGNGASMCAMTDRKSVATSMGFTALDGLIMGTRCGALDPGVVLYLMQAKGMSPADIETLLYRKSGLLGVSGLSNDMQVLSQSDDPRAHEAIALYCYHAAKILAGLIPSIGGLDALVFTAGIGENSALVRRLICDQLTWLGVVLDDTANDENAICVSTPQSRVKVLVLPTNEEAIVAMACRTLLP